MNIEAADIKTEKRMRQISSTYYYDGAYAYMALEVRYVKLSTGYSSIIWGVYRKADVEGVFKFLSKHTFEGCEDLELFEHVRNGDRLKLRRQLRP